MAIFPVKTLDSLTVVATPAAPTCLVGGTTSVALVVTAHYLTGTATSEAVVTTYTTGSNWANGVFTAATTVAGTENIVVTYTEGGVTKTANVAVTVSVAAPVPTTVTVTLTSSIPETTSATAEVVVKDQFGATMTTGFTLTYSVTTGTSSVTSAGVVTAGTYSTTAANNAHVLTVTATPTTGTAVTGTANFTVTADTTKPTITSATALNAQQIQVIYSETVDQTSAELITNYSLYSYSATTLYSMAAAAAADKIVATAKLQADNKTVLITISDTNNKGSIAGGQMSGFVLNGMTSTQYAIYISNVKDKSTAANMIVANSNKDFMGNTNPDTVPPTLLSAAYDNGSKVLTLSFNEAPASVDSSKVTFVNGTASVVLTGLTASPSGLTATITLGTTQLTTLGTIVDGASVSLAAAAVTDAASNANTAVMTATITISRPPVLTAAAFDEESLVLTLTFDQAVKVPTAGLGFGNAGDAQLLFEGAAAQNILSSNTTVLTSAVASQIRLSMSGLTLVNNDSTPAHKIKLPAGFVQTNAGVNSAAVASTDTNATLTYTEVTGAPILSSATFNNSTRVLVLTFDKKVTVSNAGVDETKIEICGYNADGTIGAAKYIPAANTSWDGIMNSGISSGTTTLTVTLPTGAATGGCDTVIDAVNAGDTIAVKLTTGFISSVGGTANLTTTTTSAVTTQPEVKITTTDAVKPTVSSVTPSSSKVVQVTFSEPVDATTAQTTTNYVVALASDPVNSQNAVVTASLDSTKKIVTLVLTTATSAAGYQVVISNIKDLSNNVMDSVTKAFTGLTSTTTPKVVAGTSNKYVIVDADSSSSLSAGDQIEIVFDSQVKLVQTNGSSWTTVTSITDKAKLDAIIDFASTAGGASDQTVLDGASLTVKSGDSTRLVLSLPKATTNDGKGWWAITPNTTTIDLNAALPAKTAANGSQSVVSTIDDGVAVQLATPQTITPPDAVAPKLASVAFVDANNDGKASYGDQLVLTYTKNIDATNVAGLANGEFYYKTTADVDNTTVNIDEFDVALTSAKVLTLTFKDKSFNGGLNLNTTVKSYFGAFKMQHKESVSTTVRDMWWNGAQGGTTDTLAKAAAVTATTSDTTSPTVVSAVFYDNDGSATYNLNDQIVVKFSKKINLSSVATTDFLFTPTVTFGGTTTFMVHATDETRLIIQLGGDATGFTGSTTVDVKSLGATSINDASGNRAMPGTAVALSSVLTADTTVPTVVGIYYYDLRNAALADADAAGDKLGQDGKVDEVVVKFSKPISDASIRTDIAATGKWLIGGVSADIVDAATDAGNAGDSFTPANTMDPKVANDQYVTVAVKAGADWTGTKTGVATAGQVTYVKNATADLAGNLLAAIASTDITETDNARPVLLPTNTASKGYDSDNNGTVDQIDLQFSEDLALAATVDTQAKAAKLVTALTVNSVGATKPSLLAKMSTIAVNNGSVLRMALSNTDVFGTGLINVTFVGNDATYTVKDGSGNIAVNMAAANITDAVNPVMLSFTSKTDANTLWAKFSEPVETNSDFTTKTIFVVDADGAGAGASVTSSNITADPATDNSTDNILVITCTAHGIANNTAVAASTLVYTAVANGFVAGSAAADKATTPQTKTGAVTNANL